MSAAAKIDAVDIDVDDDVIMTSTSTSTSTSTWLCEINSIIKSLLKIYTSCGGKISKTNFRRPQNLQKKIGSEKKNSRNSQIGIFFSRILRGFGRRTAKRTAPSARASNFALDALILRSVRPKFHPIRSRTVRQHMSSVGTRTCLDWNTRDVLVRTQEIF